jgi:hypothetical protein
MDRRNQMRLLFLPMKQLFRQNVHLPDVRRTLPCLNNPFKFFSLRDSWYARCASLAAGRSRTSGWRSLLARSQTPARSTSSLLLGLDSTRYVICNFLRFHIGPTEKPWVPSAYLYPSLLFPPSLSPSPSPPPSPRHFQPNISLQPHVSSPDSFTTASTASSL